MHLAQLNVGRLVAPIDAPEVAGFANQLEAINGLAESSPGFVWRFAGDTRQGETAVGDDPQTIYNLSVWQSLESLFAFTYRSAHRAPLAARRQWFERLDGPHLVLWWVPAGHRPGLPEALSRLKRLAGEGPGPDAFDFRNAFGPDGQALQGRAIAHPAPAA
ncbi:MAG: DUF3291 domain-containing protein [Rhodocyclaceae bacterium]|nr:DUF3291 domain-containing protein [Rhodocyclaceae bacterium]